MEEASAYTERSIDALTEQLLDLDRRMRQLATRLEAIEGRLTGVAERLAEGPACGRPGEGPDGAGAPGSGGSPGDPD